jgi:hypothetical protein
MKRREYMDPSMQLHRCAEQCLGAGLVCEIDRHYIGLAALTPYVRRDILEKRGAPLTLATLPMSAILKKLNTGSRYFVNTCTSPLAWTGIHINTTTSPATESTPDPS